MDSSLPDSTVVYKLYPRDGSSYTAVDLTQLAIKCMEKLHDSINSYIWHYERFHIGMPPSSSDNDVLHLMGTTSYRENIEDEWYIVELLLKLTREIDGLVAGITDEDGEFILIETANFLPKWLKPETAVNRVFIYQGQLHIIPQPRSPGECMALPVAVPTLSQSLKIIHDSTICTVAPPLVQRSLQNKLEKCSFHSFHCAVCYLPLPAAHVLSLNNNSLISAAVHALVNRDKKDMKVAGMLTHFSPKDHPLVPVNINFTRLLYAMIMSDKLTLSAKQWPPSADVSPQAVSLGMKLTFGLEILASCYSPDECSTSCDHTQWHFFLSNLNANKYFGDEVEGSIRYQELLKSAKEYSKHEINAKEGLTALQAAGQLVNASLLKCDWSVKQYKGKDLRPSDDDSWLYLTPESLDDMLRQQTDKVQEGNVANGMKSFVDKISSVDGAEFPWSVSADDVTAGVDFNPETFMDTCKGMLDRLSVIEDTESMDSSDVDSCTESDSCDEESRQEMNNIMEQMDNELSHTSLGESFKRKEEGDKPIDIDANLVQNLMKSYTEQIGIATPTSNILNTLGIFSKK